MADLRPATIRIRMYRVGFGDCFLLSLPTSAGHSHILIDCGAHPRADIGTLGAAVADAIGQAGNQFALIIATHAHQDHLSGFARYEACFRRSRAKEIWLPWTENPNDHTAARLRARRLAAIAQLQRQLAARPGSNETQFTLLNLTGNQKALRFLRSGMNSRVRYLESGEELCEPAGVEGLLVRVLGPPRNPEFLARVDLPGAERFLRGNGSNSLNAVRPFAKDWIFNPAAHPDFPTLPEKDCRLLENLSGDSEGLVLALDQAVNNTSLVTLFSYRGKNLLFSGDALYGNWNYWLRKREASVLLAEVDFYKVAHHGSLNGTPRAALQQFRRKKFAAMASTQEAPWPSIPAPRLMKALEERASGLVRSDFIPVRGAPKCIAPATLPKGFSRGEFWLDYEIPC